MVLSDLCFNMMSVSVCSQEKEMVKRINLLPTSFCALILPLVEIASFSGPTSSALKLQVLL
jgi:hypothetical protein